VLVACKLDGKSGGHLRDGAPYDDHPANRTGFYDYQAVVLCKGDDLVDVRLRRTEFCGEFIVRHPLALGGGSR